jgi:hypothetical protein
MGLVLGALPRGEQHMRGLRETASAWRNAFPRGQTLTEITKVYQVAEYATRSTCANMNCRLPRAEIEKCLKCDYSLVGLPSKHRCPECGEPYDKTWLYFRPQRRIRRLLSWLINVGAFLLVLQGLDILMRRATCTRDWLHLMIAGVASVGLIGSVLDWYAHRRETEYLLITPDWLEWQVHGVPRTRMLRTETAEFRVAEDAHGIEALGIGDERSWMIPVAFVPRDMTLEEFVAALSQHWSGV